MEHLQPVWLASRERLSFRTPGSVPLFGTCLCSNCWDQIPRTCHVFTRLFSWNTFSSLLGITEILSVLAFSLVLKGCTKFSCKMDITIGMFENIYKNQNTYNILIYVAENLLYIIICCFNFLLIHIENQLWWDWGWVVPGSATVQRCCTVLTVDYILLRNHIDILNILDFRTIKLNLFFDFEVCYLVLLGIMYTIL